MSLSPLGIDVAQFAMMGYCTVPDFFSPREVSGMRAELENLRVQGQARNVATDGDGRTYSASTFNLQICPLSDRSTFFRAMKWHPRVVASVRALVGDPVVFRLDQIFYKPARHGAGTNWHQDNAYWRQPHPELGVGMWVALHDATRANGTMHIVPGSHIRLEEHQRDPSSDHHIHVPDVDETLALPIELPAGGVLFFNWGTLHCTRANTTDQARAGLALHYRNADHVTPSFWDDTNNVRITGHGASGGMAEYGIRVEGTWDNELTRVLAEHGREAACVV